MITHRNLAIVLLFVSAILGLGGLLAVATPEHSLATLEPESATVVGLSLGTWNGTACAIVIANDAAVQGTIVLGQTTGSGSLCVRIFDVGNVVDPLDFTINVIHP